MAHPDPNGKSFTHALTNTAQEALTSAGHEVKVMDLYKENFVTPPRPSDYTTLSDATHVRYDFEQANDKFIDPIREEFEKIEWATHVIIIAPMWWSTLPSAVKAYMERVIAFGKSYTMDRVYDNGFYLGKKLLIVTTTGTPKELFMPRSGGGTVESRFLPITMCILAFCGFTILRTLPFFEIRKVTKHEREEYLRKWREVVLHLDKREAVPFVPGTEYEGGILKDKNSMTNWQFLNTMEDLDINASYSKLAH